MKKSLFIIILLFSLSITLSASDVKKESIMYSDSLSLDHYYAQDHTQIRAGAKQPCMIFMFGGGFFTGSKDDARYLKYYKTLAENGIHVFAIDYRLGLKSIVNSVRDNRNISVGEMISALENSIDMAVEDLYKATSCILENAGKWGIDTHRIMASGSSAGAIAALQAEYYMCNNLKTTRNTNYRDFLPENFRYAGIISFAGAILNLHGKMKWMQQPAPIMFFHGNADSNVPYRRVWTPFGSFNGSAYISKKLTKIAAPHYLYTIDNATHTVAVSPMKENLLQVIDFINKFVLEQKRLIINTEVTQPDQPKLNKRFGIKDYIKSNLK